MHTHRTLKTIDKNLVGLQLIDEKKIQLRHIMYTFYTTYNH